MMTIGEFSEATGLTIKALRHYDEVDLLTPAEVDPHTGYRHYDTAQVKTAASMSILREMGLSLKSVQQYLNDNTVRTHVLEEHRNTVLAERQRQDLLWDEGIMILDEYLKDYEIGQRTAEAMSWVGHVMPTDQPRPDDDAEVLGFQEFLKTLPQYDINVTGHTWTEFRTDQASGASVMCQAVGLTHAVPTVVPHPEYIVTGTLQPRIEKYVRMNPLVAVSPELSAPHPAAVALFHEAREDDVLGIRQVRVPDSDLNSMELVIDLPIPSTTR